MSLGIDDLVIRLIPETETSLNPSSGSHGWDQFEANERLYNVTSTYDENIYTKKLDKSTLTMEQQRQAERLAREIESQVSDNIHLREERGHALEREMDEEDLYSGVRREKEDVWARGKTVTPKHPPQRDARARSAEKSPVPLAPPPGLSRPQAKEMSEESKIEPAAEATPTILPSVPSEGSKEAEASSAGESSVPEVSATESKPRGLDPNAKPFTFNVKAPEFTPQAPPSIPSPTMGPAAAVPYGAFPVTAPFPMQGYEYPPAYMQGPPMMYPGVPPPQYEAYPPYGQMPYGYAMNYPMGYPQPPYFQPPMQGRGSSRPYNAGQGNKGYQR